MGSKSKIEWTAKVNADGTVTPGATWNPIRGCSMAKGSEAGGCLNCYAARFNARNLPGLVSPTTGKPFARILQSGPRWTGDVELIESMLTLPLKWRTPKRIFVNSQSDLFHESLPDQSIDRIVGIMAQARQHTYQILTKRSQRLSAYSRAFQALTPRQRSMRIARSMYAGHPAEHVAVGHLREENCGEFTWPLPNVWFGVSVENQATADDRIPLLLETPAAIRFVSYEPALGPVDFKERWLKPNPYESVGGSSGHSFSGLRGNHPELMTKLDWIIAGGESGPGARPARPEWFQMARDACTKSNVKFFFKQWGEYGPIYCRSGYAPVSSPEPSNAYSWGGGEYSPRLGKKASGALLDGREWREFPEAR